MWGRIGLSAASIVAMLTSLMHANFFRAAFRHCGRQGYRNQALGWNTYR